MLLSAGVGNLYFVTWLDPSAGRPGRGNALGKQCLRPHSWLSTVRKNYTISVTKNLPPRNSEELKTVHEEKDV